MVYGDAPSFDNRGGLVLPFSGKAFNHDEEWLEFKRLKIDESVKSITSNDLPEDFCDEACKLVDEFRRKTVNKKVEWMLYFDYTAGEVIYCWKGEEIKSGGKFNAINFHGRKIASIHSHSNCYSFPSPNNFDILENEFEDYEIITSVGAIWIVEFKGNAYKILREEFQFKIGDDINDMIKNIRLYYDIHDIDVMAEKNHKRLSIVSNR